MLRDLVADTETLLRAAPGDTTREMVRAMVEAARAEPRGHQGEAVLRNEEAERFRG